jgi:hypothetical protein
VTRLAFARVTTQLPALTREEREEVVTSCDHHDTLKYAAALLLREFARGHAETAKRLDALERKVTGHDEDLREMFNALRALLTPSPRTSRAIGFAKKGNPMNREVGRRLTIHVCHRLGRALVIGQQPAARLEPSLLLTTSRINETLWASAPRRISPLGLWRGFVFVAGAGKLNTAIAANLKELGYGG